MPADDVRPADGGAVRHPQSVSQAHEAGSVPTSAESRAPPGEGRPLLTVISCPECGVPAEVTERFSLPSTDGPVKHAALSCAAGHHFRMAVDRLSAQAQQQLAVQETRAGTRTVQICIHCMENPAGFWVSRRNSRVVHRPWCLSCCQELDPDLCDVTPFAG